MEPTREIFWNIQYGEILYILALIALGIFSYAIYRRNKLWHTGKPEKRSGSTGERIRAFIAAAVVDGIFHRKFFGAAEGAGRRAFSLKDLKPREFYAGNAHFLIFGGCIIFLLGAFLDFISHYFFHFMKGGFYLGYSVVTDAASILVLIGVILALVRRYAQRPDRLDNKADDLVALVLIFLVVLTGILVEGLRMAADELPKGASWAPWSPAGYVLALAFRNLGEMALLTWHRVWWWLHMLLALGAITYVSLYWNRLWHIIVSPMNVFWRSFDYKGAVAREEFAAGKSYGVAKVEDFTWKQLLDLDACVRCGRCQDACPAHVTGKPLSPKKLIQDLKVSFVERAPLLVKGGAGNPRAPLSEVVTEEVIWDCTTCGACMEVCPVFVEHVPKLVGLRRERVEMRAKFPAELLAFFENIEQRSNPWGIAPADRAKWATDIQVRDFEAGKTEYLLYVGCAGAYDARSKQVTVALAKILNAAGVSWGILGKDEKCCGDSLRRLGNEYVFEKIAKENVKMFQDKGVRKVITQCPHCFSTIKNDYRQYGADFEVMHHSELINRLLKDGRLRLNGASDLGNIVFHDSCYLGRYNDVYDAPREALATATGKKPAEMQRNYNRSFCCGGGGGRMWQEESKGKRINIERFEEALKQKPQTVCTCCPYCLTMFEDGIKDKKLEGKVKALDLVEVVGRGVEG